MIYIANTVLMIVYNTFSKTIKNGKKIGLFLSFLTMTLIVVLRESGLGADYISYNYLYRSVISLPFPNGLSIIEPGYALICYISNIISHNNYWLPHFFTGFFTMLFFYLSIKNISVDYMMSCYLFVSMSFMYNAMNQERQCLAMAISAYAISFFLNKKRIKFTLFVLLAASFHISAFIMLLLFIPDFISLFKQKRFLLIGFALITLYFSINIRQIEIFLRTMNITRFLPYLSYDSSGQQSVITNTLVRLVIVIAAFLPYRQVTKKEPKSRPLYFMVFLMISFQFAALFISAAGRVTTYFYMSLFYLVPFIFESADMKIGNKRMNKLIRFALIVALIPYHYVYFQYMIQSNNILPYRTIFSQ